MKRNKGFTLFELVVALAILAIVMAEIASIMGSSQRLYSHGVYEVQLQENAQQVVALVQDIMAGATRHIPVPDDAHMDPVDTSKVLSQIITVETSERDGEDMVDVTYRIGRGDDLGVADCVVHGDPAAGTDYTTLYLEKAVAGAPTETIPIAENVRGVRLDVVDYGEEGTPERTIPNYETADIVSLAVDMHGEKYSYSTVGEIYLRNRIGTQPHNSSLPPVPSNQYDVDLVIQRYHTYDLTDYVPDGYEYFKWADDSTHGSKYSLSGSGNRNVKTSGLNNNWGSTGQGLILASNIEDDFSAPLKISIHTDAVNEGIAMPLMVTDNTSVTTTNVIPVTGVCTCPSCSGSFDMEAQITFAELEGSVAIPGGPTYNEIKLALFKDVNHFEPSAGFGQHDVFGDYENETFQTFSGNTVDLTQLQVRVRLYRHNSGMGYEYGTDEELSHNYNCAHDPGNGILVLDNQAFPKYTLGHIHTKDTNVFTFDTNSHVTNPENYWKYVVDDDFGDGYVRIKLTVHYPSHDYVCYGYYFPQQSATQEYRDKMWENIENASD